MWTMSVSSSTHLCLTELLDASRRNSSGHDLKQVRASLGWRLRDNCTRWQVTNINSCFTRRVTSIRWHPWHPEKVAYGTHAGDIMLWNYTKPATDSLKIEGVGMGHGCITEMRFHPHNLSLLYTAAVDGKFCLKDFEGRYSDVLLDTMTLDYWWCSMDYSRQHGVLLVGDNRGAAVLMDMSNHKTLRTFNKLHKGKIKYMEFCPARNWMLVTASVDRTIKLWDVRMLRCGSAESARPTPLSTAIHEGVVSSAYFDPIHGVRLLTTSQNGEIRVYEPHNLWQEPSCIISHPHRSFQHMTDIKATWHPLYENMCVIGRYPNKEDPDQLRTVDLIDLRVRERCGQFHCPHLSGIIQLNQFSRNGDCLASGMGYNGLIWKPLQDSVKMRSRNFSSGMEAVLRSKASKNRKRRCPQDKKNKLKKMKVSNVTVCYKLKN